VVHVMPFPHKPLNIAVVFLVDGGKAERGGDSGDREGEGHGLPAGLLRRLCRGLFFGGCAELFGSVVVLRFGVRHMTDQPLSVHFFMQREPQRDNNLQLKLQ
jgi:hypothetical protein